jgi:hypothetical protein
MNLSESFIERFNMSQRTHLKDTHPELELKLLLDPRVTRPNYIKKLDLEYALNKCQELFKHFTQIGEGIPANTQTMNFIYPPVNDSWDEYDIKFNEIKELHFHNGIQDKDSKRYYKKGNNSEPEYIKINSDYNFKATFNLEVDPDKPIADQRSKKSNYYLIRFKNRFTFLIPHWQIDFTFVKSSTSKLPTVIKTIKDKLFTDVTSENIFDSGNWIWEYADTVEIEFEYRDNDEINQAKLDTILDVIIDSDNISDERVTKFTKHLKVLVGNQGTKSTMKSILPNAVEIDKKQYFDNVLGDIDNFYITPKIDGLRSLLIIDTDIELYTSEFQSLGKNEWFKGKTAIMEGEYHEDIFYAYDILEYNGQNLTGDNFQTRYKTLVEFNGIWKGLHIKEFVRLTTDSYKKEIPKLVESNKKWNLQKSKKYHIDGIIFTSAMNRYTKTKFYKWKPYTDITIDFLAKRCPKLLQGISPYVSKRGKQLYVLFNGVNKNTYKKLNIQKIKYYDTLFPRYGGDYFPIQFSPSDNQIAYLFWHDTDIDGKVVELNRDTKSDEWNLVKIREDRMIDMKNKTYYGNDYRVAELIWRNYVNPLTVADLTMDIEDLAKDFYFQTSHSEDYKAVRKFNNMVKSEILNRFTNYNEKDTVVDLGCGKGQDLMKYAMIPTIKNCIMIDSNENNLSEVVERKYSFVDNHTINGSLNVSVQCLDLLKNWKTNLDKLKYNLPFLQRNNVKLVVCNFAIHYFVKSTTDIDNLVDFVDQFMPSGSRFIFTCLDGKMIHNMLSSGKVKGEWGDGSKYLIKAKYTNKIFKGGEEIELLLPFSNGVLYSEYLVNLDLLERRLKRKRILLETCDEFKSYLDKFKFKNIDLYTTLNKMDMEYLDLLKFCIYYKK